MEESQCRPWTYTKRRVAADHVLDVSDLSVDRPLANRNGSGIVRVWSTHVAGLGLQGVREKDLLYEDPWW